MEEMKSVFPVVVPFGTHIPIGPLDIVLCINGPVYKDFDWQEEFVVSFLEEIKRTWNCSRIRLVVPRLKIIVSSSWGDDHPLSCYFPKIFTKETIVNEMHHHTLLSHYLKIAIKQGGGSRIVFGCFLDAGQVLIENYQNESLCDLYGNIALWSFMASREHEDVVRIGYERGFPGISGIIHRTSFLYEKQEIRKRVFCVLSARDFAGYIVNDMEKTIELGQL